MDRGAASLVLSSLPEYDPGKVPGPECCKWSAIANRGIHFSLDNAIASTALGSVESCIDGSDYSFSLIM
jgi:hypothetical protein